MAIPRRIPLDFDATFPHGFALMGEGTPAKDFKASTKERVVQAVDIDSGLPLWQFEGMDLDPGAHKSARLITVKIAAQHQPVPAAVGDVGPFKLVRLQGLQASPYVKRDGDFSSLQWSYFATGFGSSAAKSDKAA